MKRQISPSILSFDLTNIRESVQIFSEAGADWLHLDVMDGQFVPPISFGSSYVSRLREFSRLPFEAHLMTLTPERHFDAFLSAGCQRILFHIEATAHAHRLVQYLHENNSEAGIVLNPATPVEAVMPLLPMVDLVLVMTVNPGWGGQGFLPEALSKVQAIRRVAPHLDIEIDGGVNPSTLAQAEAAGANVFVVGNYLASAPDLRAAMRSLCIPGA